jgi:DNA-binding NarL/FixJ family response regulator
MREAFDGEPASDGEAPIRVLVVDCHDLFRTGLRRLLEDEGLHVVADERSAENGVRVAAELEPEVITMDVDMPGMSGIEATSRVLEIVPSAAVVMLTTVDDEQAVPPPCSQEPAGIC